MKTLEIKRVESADRRFTLHDGAGSDAVHSVEQYAFACTRLCTGTSVEGFGITLTLGQGNQLVCEAIEQLGTSLIGFEIEDLMRDFGSVMRSLADDSALRWLGPHKGVLHLALSSIVNACYDLWAKYRGVPLWRLLLDLTPEQLVNLLDLSYIDDELTVGQAIELLSDLLPTRAARESILKSGYPGYDTSIGWFSYDDTRIRDNIRKALDLGFRAFKLKVGSSDSARDLRRAELVRNAAGPDAKIMFDANQQWSFRCAVQMCSALQQFDPYWVEEPTHPDDVNAHARLVARVVPSGSL